MWRITAFAARILIQEYRNHALTGVVTKVEWTNPHMYIHLDVKDAGGKVTNWALEGYPPNTLKRTGFMRDSVKEGETITITAYKAKDGSNMGAGREVTFPDGSKKFAGPRRAVERGFCPVRKKTVLSRKNKETSTLRTPVASFSLTVAALAVASLSFARRSAPGQGQ